MELSLYLVVIVADLWSTLDRLMVNEYFVFERDAMTQNRSAWWILGETYVQEYIPYSFG